MSLKEDFCRLVNDAVSVAVESTLEKIAFNLVDQGYKKEHVEAALGKAKLSSPNTHTHTTPKPEIPFVILNYTSASHALFGDFGKKYTAIKDEYLKTSKNFRANAKLSYGFGWIFKTDGTILNDLKNKFEQMSIPLVCMTREQYENQEWNTPESAADTLSRGPTHQSATESAATIPAHTASDPDGEDTLVDIPVIMPKRRLMPKKA
jgi:hypothetical protein